MRYAIAWITLLAAVGAAHAQEQLSRRNVNALERSMVAVRISGGGYVTGFVVANDGDQAYCVAPARSFNRQRDYASVIIKTGERQNPVARGDVVSTDTQTNLMVIRFQHDPPPPPLRLDNDVDVPASMPVFLAGFASKIEQPSKGPPPIAVTQVMVAAQVRDNDGMVVQLQLKGELDPGTSGGPLVRKDGRVDGIAMIDTDQSNTGYAVSADVIETLLRGSVERVRFLPQAGSNAYAECAVEASVVDPLERITSVYILTALASRQNDAAPQAPGETRELVGARAHRLQVEDGVARGEVRLPRPVLENPHLCQIKYQVERSGTHYTKPEPLHMGDPAEAAPRQPDARPHAALGRGALELVEDFGVPDGPLGKESRLILPDEAVQADIAGGGRYLVIQTRDTPALIVIDLFTAHDAKYIPMPTTDFVFGAGGNRAVVHFRERDELASYDLTTLAQVGAKANPFEPYITNIVLGHSRSGRAIVRHAPSDKPGVFASVDMLDTARLMRVAASNRDRRDQRETPGVEVHDRTVVADACYRANGDLTAITKWKQGGTPSGVGLFVWRSGAYERTFLDQSRGYLICGDDDRIYTGQGWILNEWLEPVGQIENEQLFPGIGGLLYVALAKNGDLTVALAGETEPLAKLDPFPDWREDQRRGSGVRKRLRPDQRIAFAPQFGRIAFITPDDSAVVVCDFDLKGMLDKAGADYLVVLSQPDAVAQVGAAWEYTINVLSNSDEVGFELELGPAGMKVDKRGRVTWTPTATAPESAAVIILIKGRAGKQTFHKFNVRVEGS